MARSWRLYLFGAVCFFLAIAYFKPASQPHNLSWTSPGLYSDGNTLATVVVAALKKDDVRWIDIGYWDVWKYEVDNPNAKHTVPKNKGNEAMVYLTHIINEYDNLSPRVIFVHAGRYQWHNDDPKYDLKKNLQSLRLKHVDQEGYVSLRCHWFQGCPSAINPTTAPYLKPSAALDSLYTSTFTHLFPTLPIPETVASTCCSQFAVTASAIRSHEKDVYIKIRKWLMDTEMDDFHSGRVLEYMWHILFGKEAVNCPDAGDCYCRLYGKCGLKCKEGDCGVYQYPFMISSGWQIKGYYSYLEESSVLASGQVLRLMERTWGCDGADKFRKGEIGCSPIAVRNIPS